MLRILVIFNFCQFVTLDKVPKVEFVIVFSAHQKNCGKFQILISMLEGSILAENTDFELSILSRYEFSVVQSKIRSLNIYTIYIYALFSLIVLYRKVEIVEGSRYR